MICSYCLKDGGHTEHCDKLKQAAYDSNLTFAIRYMMMRATVSGCKQLGETNPNLIKMWSESVDMWCGSATNLIERAVKEGKANTIYMPDA